MTLPPLLAQFSPLPVFIKETRSRFRGNRALSLLLWVTLLMCITAVFVLLLNWAEMTDRSATAVIAGITEAGRTLFVVLLFLQLAATVLLVPAYTAGAFSSEREAGSLELLLLTPLTNANLVAGKLLSAVGYLLLVQLCALPLVGVNFILGGFSVSELLQGAGLLLSVTLAVGCLCLYLSLLTHRMTLSLLLGYAAGVAWLGGIWGLAFAEDVLNEAGMVLSLFVRCIPLAWVCALILAPLVLRKVRLQPWAVMLWLMGAYLAGFIFVLYGILHHGRHADWYVDYGLLPLFALPVAMALVWGLTHVFAWWRWRISGVMQVILVVASLIWLTLECVNHNWSISDWPLSVRYDLEIWAVGNPIFTLMQYIESGAIDGPAWLARLYPYLGIAVQLLAAAFFFNLACRRLAALRRGG
jgi:hypothetical protein